MKKKLIVGFLLVFLVVVGIEIYHLKKPEVTKKTEASAKEIYIYLVLPTKNGELLTQISKGKTALDLLEKYSKVGLQGNGVNAFVTTIDGLTADASKRKYWAFYVNGKLADVGAGSYKLQNGDKIVWKIESY